MKQMKDDVLAELSRGMNVAQFFSVRANSPNMPKYVCIRGLDRDECVSDLGECINQLLVESIDSMVNVRTFTEFASKGGEFLMGLKTVQEVTDAIGSLTAAGSSIIVNESIDVCDGGVSGVLFGNTIEFAPEDTPRCVEKPEVCRLPSGIGRHILNRVYGIELLPNAEPSNRIEFSLHPRRRGINHSQVIIWEVESQDVPAVTSVPAPRWPNRFSRHIGDKVFGLLIAEAIGCSVPRATVICRKVRPFILGSTTGTNEYWCRTAPNRQIPGKLPTVFGNQDVFSLLVSVKVEDRDALASVLYQESVDAEYSGGAAVRENGEFVIEGVAGFGDDFMLGKVSPGELPDVASALVRQTLSRVRDSIGPCRIEWVFDGTTVWVVQLHVGAICDDPVRIVDGETENWVDFEVERGLESLRDLLDSVEREGSGLRLVGDVGVTSHFGDLLRGRGIPSVIVPKCLD